MDSYIILLFYNSLMSVIITPATQKDYFWFVEIFKEVEEFHRLQAPWKFQKPEPELFAKSYYDDIITHWDSRLLLAKDGEHVVWFIMAFKRISNPIPVLQPRVLIEIDNLMIQDEYKKKGIGKLLLQKIEDWAKEIKVTDIELHVWWFNEWAIKFYEKSWYTIISHNMRKVIWE